MHAQSVEHLDEYLVGINVTTHQKSDLDIYLDLDREDAHTLHDVNFKYDVLGWWKNNGHRHPVLCEMVRDIFGVPISTVPSESAFSTSGRVLDSFRSSLSPSIAEALFSAVFFFCSATAIV
ncbi:Zinc finger BED domain-containing protein RICESLEEPER 2 [Linum perenne]